MRSTTRLAAFALSGMLGSAVVVADDWPYYRGPNCNGVSLETGWNARALEQPKVLWKADVGVGAASMITSNGRLYTMGNKDDADTVYCFNAETGDVVWKHSYACPRDDRMFEGGTASTPTIAGKHLYTLSQRGHLFCLDAQKGTVVWSKNLMKDFGGSLSQWHYAGSPLVATNTLIVEAGGKGTSVVALDKNTGKELWRAGSEKAGYATPVVFKSGGKDAVLVFNSAGLVAHDLATGKELWRFRWKTSYDVNAATPLVFDNKVFISSGYNRGCALVDISGAQPKLLVENKHMQAQFPTPILYQGHIYGISGNTPGGELRCLDARDLKARWSKEGLGTGGLTLAGDKLIVQGEKGDLVIAQASPDGYKEISRAKVLSGRCWVQPILSNGKIYTKDNEGQLVAIAVK